MEAEKCTFLPHDPFPHAELTPACGTVISACGDLTPHAESVFRMRSVSSACGKGSCGRKVHFSASIKNDRLMQNIEVLW